MKKIIIVLAVLFFGCIDSYSQSMSCQEVFDIVTSKYDRKESTTCFGSTMLVKVDYYTLDNNGFVVAYIKSNDYDFSGKPYIFCGISSMTWINFKVYGMNGWGEAFHKYIMDYKCNCK